MLGTSLVRVPWKKSTNHPKLCAAFKAALSFKSRPIVRISTTATQFSPLRLPRWAIAARQLRTKAGAVAHLVNVVGAIASTEETTDLNRKPSHGELQRYGLDESDYDYTAIDPPSSSSVGMPPRRKTAANEKKRKAPTEWTEKPRTLKEESGVVEDWCAYLLLSADSRKTYVGVTYDIKRRLRQHNGEISGGAKSARAGRPWRLLCTVRGFHTRSEACQFEWRWKSTAAKVKTIREIDATVAESPLVTRRRATLAEVIGAKEEWSSLNIQWH